MIGYATFSDSQIERRAETEECVPKRSDIHVVRKSATLTQPSNRMRKMLPLRSKNAHAKADQKHQYDKSEEVYRRTRFAAMSWLFTFAFILLVISIENMKIANRLILSSMSIPLVATSIMVLLNFRTQGLDTWYYTANKLVEFAICIALYKLLHNEPYSLKLLVFLYAQALSAEGSKVCHFFRIIMCAAAMFEYYPNQLSYLVLITSNVDVVMELAKPHFKKQPKKTDTKDEESTKDTPASASDHEAKIGAPRPEDKLQSPSQMALVEAPKISINLPRDSSKSSEQMNDEVLLDAVGPTATTRRGPEASLSKSRLLS